MTENSQIAMAAINKWVYFSLNYDVVPYTSIQLKINQNALTDKGEDIFYFKPEHDHKKV